MKYEVGQLITGTVYAVKPYALFLSFSDGATGLLHISEISDSFIRDIERYGTVGDQIKVKIVSIDKANGFLRLSLKKVPQERRKKVLLRELFIALFIMMVFFFTGSQLLSWLGIEQYSLAIAGGIILFILSIYTIYTSSLKISFNFSLFFI